MMTDQPLTDQQTGRRGIGKTVTEGQHHFDDWHFNGT